jgi:hypothetical protein
MTRALRVGRRPAIAFVWTMWIISAAFVAVSLVTADGLDNLLPAAALGLTAISFATVGAVLVSRLPTNPIGWLLASGGFWFGLGNGATSLGNYGLVAHPGSVPGAVWFAWFSEWTWAPAVGAILLLLLVYPTGRLLSRRWLPEAAGAILLIALLSFGGAFGQWTSGQFPEANPLAIAGSMPDLLTVLLGPIASLVVLSAVASLAIRFRRSAGIERAQLKWFAAVAAVSLPAFFIGTGLFGTSGLAGAIATVCDLLAFVGFALLPVAIGVAVLRYRLFEIDRLISRTIAYGLLTATVGGLFVGGILVLGAALGSVTGSNELAVAGSTLLVFALFQPLRRRLQRVVDRRFNRARYDAERTVAAFTARLADEVDLEHLRAEILGTVSAAVEPISVSMWLRP